VVTAFTRRSTVVAETTGVLRWVRRAVSLGAEGVLLPAMGGVDAADGGAGGSSGASRVHPHIATVSSSATSR
jgi:glycerate kinase